MADRFATGPGSRRAGRLFRAAVILLLAAGAGSLPAQAQLGIRAANSLQRGAGIADWIGRGLDCPAPIRLASRMEIAPHLAPERWQMSPTPGTPRRGPSGNSAAILTALMSAVVPGAGQVRNGSILRGLGYLALEIGGWTAYLSFRQGADDRLDEVSRAADQGWDIERYWNRAQHPDSCAACGCPDGEEFGRDYELISETLEGSRTRFLEYIGRPAYGCGWSSATSLANYEHLWNDRDDMQSAQRWAGRLLFLNHLVAAVDAFFEARAMRLRLDDQTELQLDLSGLPRDVRPGIRITRRF